jgi:hypothetical protein
LDDLRQIAKADVTTLTKACQKKSPAIFWLLTAPFFLGDRLSFPIPARSHWTLWYQGSVRAGA